MNYEPLGSWLTGFLRSSLGLSSAVLFLLGGLRVITSRREWIKEFPFQSLLFHWCCARASLTGIKRLPKTFCVSTVPQFILNRANTRRKPSKLLHACSANRNPLQSLPGKQGSDGFLMVHGCTDHCTPRAASPLHFSCRHFFFKDRRCHHLRFLLFIIRFARQLSLCGDNHTYVLNMGAQHAGACERA